MIWAISYGNEKYEKSRDFNLKSALSKGKVDKVIAYGPDDIEKDVFEKNKSVFTKSKGAGYWLWKPYFIYKTLEKMPENDYLIYTDSGMTYVRDVRLLINCMEKHQQKIMCFEIEAIEKSSTKRDLFIALDCDTAEYTDSRQRLGGIVICKNCEYSRNIIFQWLSYAQDETLITDCENTLGLPNYPEFMYHRHDQSIWSLITKKNDIPAFRDPTHFGKFGKVFKESAERSNYPTIFYLHRSGSVTSWFKVYCLTFSSWLYLKFKFYRKLYELYGKAYRFYEKHFK